MMEIHNGKGTMTSPSAKRRRKASDTGDLGPTEVVLSDRKNEFSENTWWLVDLDSQSQVTQGATPLVKRCMRVYGWDAPKTRKFLVAYRQFLTLKKEQEDWDATVLSPCFLVDQMWHQHILDVVNYCHDMMLICGRVIGHNPDGGASGKAERDENTASLLEQRFPDYDKDVWGHPLKLRFRDQRGNEEIIEAVYKDSMEGAFREYAQRRRTALDLVEFKLNGRVIHMTNTPEDLGLRNNALIGTFLSTVGTIRIRLKDQTGEETMCTVKRSTRMG